MNTDLFAHPQLFSLLEAARQAPEDDVPRLVLADWLEDHGADVRAEFLRLQCRLAPGAALPESSERMHLQGRCQELLSRHGGAWLGPLWQYWLSPLCWHRGLLAVQMPRRWDAALADILPWIDTALFRVNGVRSLQRALLLLAHMSVNHVCLELRQVLREEVLLRELGRVPEMPCLRSLTIDWPYRQILRHEDRDQEGRQATPAVAEIFLQRLLAECALSRHLTHLASTTPFSAGQAAVIRKFGVEPRHAEQRLWMHDVAPACFRQRTERSGSCISGR